MSSRSTLQLEVAAAGIYRGEILSIEDCELLIELMTPSATWAHARIGAQHGAAVAVSTVRDAEVLHEDGLDCAHVRAAVARALPFVSELVDEPLSLGPLEFVRYPAGGQYRVHSDWGPATFRRTYTALVYLNDDFTGGETAFPDLGYQATPRAGDLLLFPSHLLHCGNPVAHGSKYIAVGWLLAEEIAPWIARA